MMMQKMTVNRNTRITSKYYVMSLNFVKPFEYPRPGQFVMVQIPEMSDVFWRRPFSIHRVVYRAGHLHGIELLYRVVGKGTQRLAGLKNGDTLDVLGPLGRGFDIPEDLDSVFVVGGGIGVAPLAFLLSELRAENRPPISVSVFLGARSAEDLLCVEELEKIPEGDGAFRITTEDGSLGERGLITAVLEKSLEENLPGMVYACGPHGMMKEVSRLASRFKTRCQISLETVMACGMGACLGCAIKNAKHPDRYDHVCLDGPVFDLGRFQF